MKLTQRVSHGKQRGIVAVLAVIFLITAVIFVMTQTLNITGTTSIDNKQQLDSTAALFLAESGLEKAQAIIATAAKGSFSKDNCCIAGSGTCSSTNSLPSGAQSLGGGSFTYASATPTPSTCDGSATPCTACAVVVTGTMDNANRQVSRAFNLVPTPAYCNTANTDDCSNQAANSTTPPTWSLTLGKYTVPAYAGVGVFNLGTVPGPSGATLTDCYTTGLGCLATGVEQWKLSNGGSIFGLGNTVVQSTTDVSVYQRLSDPGKRNDVALSGALFPGSASATGTVVGTYSDGSSGAGSSTVGGSTTLKGMTTNGSALGAWCDGGDTLAFGYSAHSSSAKTNGLQTGQLLFNTSGGSGVPLISVTKTPTNVDTNAGDKVYSEIWYKSNPTYSYGKWIEGYTIPVPFYFVGDVNKAPTNSDKPYYHYATLVYSGPTTTAVLGVGDQVTIAKADCPSDPFNNLTNRTNKIVGFGNASNQCDTTPGTTREVKSPLVICMEKDVANSGNSCKAVLTGIFNLTTLEVTSVNGISDAATAPISSIIHGAGIAANGDSLVGPYVQSGTTLVNKLATDPGAIATYSLSRPTTSVNPQNMVVGGATVSGSTVTLNGNAAIPAPTNVPSTNALLALRVNIGASTNGKLPANTAVSSTSSPTITLSKSAVTNSVTNGAVICGGSCAFFDQTPLAKTEFQIGTSLPTGTDYWTAGFVCLKNVGVPTALLGGSGAKVVPGVWREIIK